MPFQNTIVGVYTFFKLYIPNFGCLKPTLVIVNTYSVVKVQNVPLIGFGGPWWLLRIGFLGVTEK
jgi:hypothetical protein